MTLGRMNEQKTAILAWLLYGRKRGGGEYEEIMLREIFNE
jgi:hypothetical protein